jgi:surface protein
MGCFPETNGSWDVSRVRHMSQMFRNASSFNQDIGSWDVSNMTDMSAMFLGASVYDQYVGCWNLTMQDPSTKTLDLGLYQT